MLSSFAIYWNRSLTFVKSTFAPPFSSIFYHVLQPILITFCQPIDPFWNDIFQLQTAQEVAVWWSLSDNRGESGYRRRYSWLHARHFIFHARVPIVPSWQQFRLSYCVAWFLLIPRWLEWSGQSQHNCSDYYKTIRILSKSSTSSIWLPFYEIIQLRLIHDPSKISLAIVDCSVIKSNVDRFWVCWVLPVAFIKDWQNV